MSYLDRLISDAAAAAISVYKNGVALVLRSVLDFKGAGVSVADNAVTKRTDVTIPGTTFDATLPTTIAVTSVAGVSTSAAHRDHVHAHGTLAGGLHALAVASVSGVGGSAGEISAVVKEKIDGIGAGANVVDVGLEESEPVLTLDVSNPQHPLFGTDLSYVAVGGEGFGAHAGFMPSGDKSKLDAYPSFFDLEAAAVILRSTGGDDTTAIQAAFTASPTTPVLMDPRVPFLFSGGITIPRNARIRSLDPSRPATLSPTAWAPAVSSANDSSIALLSITATVAGSGTTLSAIYRGNDWFIKVASAAALSLVGDGTDIIRIYSSTASGSDWNGENGSERYDVVGVRRVMGDFLILWRPLYCTHASGALVRTVTTPADGIKISGLRLSASSGSIPVGLRLEGVTDSEIDIEVRGFSHAAVLGQYGCARLKGKILHDGECNSALLPLSIHDSEGLEVHSTGQGERYHRNGIIRGLVHLNDRNVRGPTKGHKLKNGCTGMFLRGTINCDVAHVDVDDMDLAERVRRPIELLWTANSTTGLVSLFVSNTGDQIEIREGDDLMVASGTLPTGYSAQVRYSARDVTTSSCKLAATPGGTVIIPSTTGVGFGGMVIARNLVLAASGTNLWTCAGHRLVNGDAIGLDTITGLALPGGFTGGALGDTYYVINVVAGVSFQLSATPGGGVKTVTSAGDGFTCFERRRYDVNTTLSRTGLVRVAAAGIEINDGNPSDLVGPGPFRNLGLSMNDVTLNCCKVPDPAGNQWSLLMVDTVNARTNGIRITNMGHTDSGAADGHILGAGFGDNYNCKHVGWHIQGAQYAIGMIWGWNIHSFVGMFACGRDGQSNPDTFMLNGMSDATTPADLDIQFDDVEITGYTTILAAHPSTWFAGQEASYQKFHFKELRVGALGAFPGAFNDVRCLKNGTGGTVSYGDIVQQAEFAPSGSPGTVGGLKAILAASDDPDGTGAVIFGGGAASNGFCLAAFGGELIATVKTGDTPTVGGKLYVASGVKTLTTTAGAFRPRGLARNKGAGGAGEKNGIGRA